MDVLGAVADLHQQKQAVHRFHETNSWADIGKAHITRVTRLLLQVSQGTGYSCGQQLDSPSYVWFFEVR